ncbi:MAG TPA: hypothetical protein VGI11_05565 [Variovorax sp.]|jgi:hypothetical protein
MKKIIRSSFVALTSAGALLGAFGALAASADDAAKCNDPRVDRAACLREMQAADQAKRQGQLTSSGNYEQNRLARCQRLPAADQPACEKRVTGAGDTSVRGSVEGGGKIRTTEVPVAPGN